MRPPCKVDGVMCGERTDGCRDGCERYREWMERHEAALKNKRKHYENVGDGDRYYIDACIRQRKRRSR